MGNDFDEQKAQEELKKGYESAKKLLNNQDALEKFLQELETKLKIIPQVGDLLSTVPTMISLTRNYVKKEYADIPLISIIAITSALIYVLSPIDVIPDFVPGAGYLDDAAVIAACLKLVKSDVEKYDQWRKDTGRSIN